MRPHIAHLCKPNATSLAQVAEALSAQLDKTVSIDTVLQGLRAHVQLGTQVGMASAQTALSMAETTVAAAEAAAEAAAQRMLAKGAEEAAVNAARQRARQAVLQQGVRQVAARGIPTTVAGVIGSLSGFWILLALGVAGLITAGVIMSRGDKQIESGPAMNRPRPTQPNVAAFDTKPESPGDKYYIYAVNTSGWSFYVGRPSDVENRAGNSIQDGGTGDEPIEYKKLVEQPFKSSDEAKEYLKARVTPGKESVWTGKWLKFGGEEYRTVHVGL